MKKIMNLSTFIEDKAQKRGKHRIIFYKNNSVDQWISLTWNELNQKVNTIAKALVAIDIQEMDTVGVISQNMPQSIIVDFACYANRSVVVPMFSSLAPSQISYIVNDASIKLVFVGEQAQYDAVVEALKDSPSIKRIVVFDESVELKGCNIAFHFSELFKTGEENSDKMKIVRSRQKNSTPKDLVNIIYTSGTTGLSKGVMITNESITEAVRIHDIKLKMKKGNKSLAFLPMSHVFERFWTYVCIQQDVKVYINQYPSEIQKTIREVNPHYMSSVPRFWEKVYIEIQQKLDTFKPFKKAMVAWALAVGELYNINHVRIGKKASLSLFLRYNIANRLIFGKVKKIIGIYNAVFLPTAGATMSDQLTKFFISIGVPIMYGYGLTETCASVSCYPYKNYTIGSIGTLMPDIQVRIGEDNEIQVKGKTVTPGYFNNPEETEKAFVDGWFRTGDMGKLDGDTLYITDRIKDLFKTSNGKYISPQAIETTMTTDPYIEQIAVIGNNRNYVTAIISPSIPLLKKFAEDNSIKYERIEDIFDHPLVIKLYEEKISVLQKDFASYETIKNFRFIRKNFSVESGELTSTLKLKRAVIQQNYTALIDEMYSDTDSAAR